MRSARIAWITVVFTVLSLVAVTAGATPTARERAEAKKLSLQAQSAFKRHRYKNAAEAYRRADQLDPSPQFKLNLARSLVGSGKLLEANRILSALQEAPATSPTTQRTQSAAGRLQQQIEPKIPTLQVIVTGPKASEVRTFVDTQELALTSEAPIDPGEHVLVVEANGFRRDRRQITLAQREHQKLTIALAPVEEPRRSPSPGAKPAEATSTGGSKLPAAIAFGVGAIGMGVGTVFGLLALSETSSAKASCEGNVCPDDPDVVSSRNAALRDGDISTVAFISGGVAVAVGLVLLAVSSGPSKPATGKAGDASIQPWIGVGKAGVAGTF